MKWIRYIWILIVIYIVCSARTCNESEEGTAKEEEQYTTNLMRSVKDVFTSDSLSDHLLSAYEITAAERLNDFADYMKIISDTTLDLKFRQHAAEIVRDLFVPEEVNLTDWNKVYPGSGLVDLEHLLSYSLSEGISCWIRPIQITILKPFTSLNDSTFTGCLSFNYNSVPLNSRDKSEIASGKLVIDIYLIKMLSYFGKERLRVWEVYLGDINQAELADKPSMPQL
jgi:hypothetical protein